MKTVSQLGQSTSLRHQDATLHHIGFVVGSISKVVEDFVASLGGPTTSEIFHDPLQEVNVTFLYSNSGGPAIELVEPVGSTSGVSKFAERGGGLHHLCYEVESLQAELAFARSQGGIVVKQPLPAVAFGGRRIAWVLTKCKLLVEYLERQTPEF